MQNLPFKARRSNMKCCRKPLRCLEEKLGGQTTSTEQSEIPKYTVRVGFLLSWLASNLYRLMGRNGHVFILRLHKFLHSSDRWRPRKNLLQPLFFSQQANQRDKRKQRLFCSWTRCIWAYARTVDGVKLLRRETTSWWASKQAANKLTE